MKNLFLLPFIRQPPVETRATTNYVVLSILYAFSFNYYGHYQILDYLFYYYLIHECKKKKNHHHNFPLQLVLKQQSREEKQTLTFETDEMNTNEVIDNCWSINKTLPIKLLLIIGKVTQYEIFIKQDSCCCMILSQLMFSRFL